MVTVYYKIFRAARRIVTEERRARAHLKQVEEGSKLHHQQQLQQLQQQQMPAISQSRSIGAVAESSSGGTTLPSAAAQPFSNIPYTMTSSQRSDY